jgi:hypothetical protein
MVVAGMTASALAFSAIALRFRDLDLAPQPAAV